MKQLKRLLLIALYIVMFVIAPMLLVEDAEADGLTPFVGLGMNTRLSSEYVSSEAPQGIFGVRYETKYITPFLRHISSIPQMDETKGINEIGLKLNYKYKAITMYIGKVYNGRYTGEYYTNQLSKYSTIGGLEINYKDKDLFIELRDSNKKNMFWYGVLWKFNSEDLRY